MAIVFILIAVSSCTKDAFDDNSVWDSGENYPFVLPEAMRPYQYAIYEDDMDLLFGYIQLRFEEMENYEEDGYFILSSNVPGNLIYFGFITETSSYYNPNIWIVPDEPTDPDDGGGMCFDRKEFQSTNFKEAQAWAKERMSEGYEVSINKRGKGGQYLAIAQK